MNRLDFLRKIPDKGVHQRMPADGSTACGFTKRPGHHPRPNVF